MPDAFGRPELAPNLRAQIDVALKAIPDGKRGALLILASDQGASAHLAARFDHGWKVAGGIGVVWTETKPSAFVAVERSW